jgi:hypothetical protein
MMTALKQGPLVILKTDGPTPPRNGGAPHEHQPSHVQRGHFVLRLQNFLGGERQARGDVLCRRAVERRGTGGQRGLGGFDDRSHHAKRALYCPLTPGVNLMPLAHLWWRLSEGRTGALESTCKAFVTSAVYPGLRQMTAPSAAGTLINRCGARKRPRRSSARGWGSVRRCRGSGGSWSCWRRWRRVISRRPLAIEVEGGSELSQ